MPTVQASDRTNWVHIPIHSTDIDIWMYLSQGMESTKAKDCDLVWKDASSYMTIYW